MVTVWSVSGVHAYHTDWIGAATPASSGSPGSPVASTLAPARVPPSGEKVWAWTNSSLAGRLTTVNEAVAVSPVDSPVATRLATPGPTEGTSACRLPSPMTSVTTVPRGVVPSAETTERSTTSEVPNAETSALTASPGAPVEGVT